MSVLHPIAREKVSKAIHSSSTVQDMYCDENTIHIFFYNGEFDAVQHLEYECTSTTPEQCEYLYDSIYGYRDSEVGGTADIDSEGRVITLNGSNEYGENVSLEFNLTINK